MFRHTLLLLLLAGSASAQTAPDLALAPVAAAPARYTAADTVRAVHRLFAKRRKLGSILTVGAVGADLALAGVSAAAEDTHKSSGGGYGWSAAGLQFSFGDFAIIYGVIAAPVMGVGIQQLIAYGPKREAKVLNQYNATGMLPAKIKRQLRRQLR